MPRLTIEWLFPADLNALAPVHPGQAFARVLIADLRDPLALPLLRPAPRHGDYLDERRPAASDRTYFLARRSALRSLVAHCLDCPADAVEIAYNAGGAPQAVAPAACFVSVSGRGPAAVLAVSSLPVGVDFEPATEMVAPVADVLHADERTMLAGLDEAAQSQRFLQIWTAKEAYVKALGVGFNRDPADIAVHDGTTQDDLRILDRGLTVDVAAARRLSGKIGDVPVVVSCIVLKT
ncbi:4'-phosphopantetheinyl transferase superfamily protein [Roseiarcaceae bacterium H3SJ34-1]|uniref:4'-phosphopantetheinyl transferase family protein n=1 Tax=Terripilifer ovatus TaxID=3032367 RepID=UPI003AB96FFD|nr:4'-phosphopantetheinyl transferase superfamily protein [Roseiarcaceae bacterium H3SJ34-1]